MSLNHIIRIGIVAGEMSGDILGAGLIAAIKKKHQSVEFIGVGGPKMIKQGFQSLVPMEELSVMGISGVILRYFKIKKIFNRLVDEFTKNPPDVFIGIDYSHFNLLLEGVLKKKGIKTVQYVSPKVWAWRQHRVFKIKKAVDMVLTIFPFEKKFYDQYHVPAHFVGHPLADDIEMNIETNYQKKLLGYAIEDRVIAVLPGSRVGELKHMGPLFLDVMHIIQLKYPDMHFIVPMASPLLRKAFELQRIRKGYSLKIKIIDGQSQTAMSASDLVVVKCGTATLEAMLLKRPMVVAFKCSTLTFAIIAPQVKIPYYSLPNLLAGRRLVPEYIQFTATAKSLADEVFSMLADSENVIKNNQEYFEGIHYQLRKNANETAANVVLNLIGKLTECEI